MKANGAIRIPTVACRISPKRTLTRILMKSIHPVEWGTRPVELQPVFHRARDYSMGGQLKWGMPVWISVFFFLFSALVLSAQTAVTPAQYLASQPKPNFAASYSLPHLTRWGGCLDSNTDFELANNWGYCLELYGYATPANVSNDVSNVTMSGTFSYTMIQLASNNPAKYKLSVLIDRTFPTPIPNGFWITNAAGLFVDPYSNAWPQNVFTNGGWRCSTNTTAPYPYFHPTVSPEGPDAYWTNATEYWMRSLRVIQSNAPIAAILNGGEYGMGVEGFELGAWQQDPRVQVQAAMTNAWATNNPGGVSWPRYISDRKAHQLGFLTSAIKQQLPNRELSIFYKTDNEMNRGYNQWYLYWDNLYDVWGWRSDVMNTNTDLPSFEDYYSNLGSWTNNNGIPKYNLLTLHLNAVGFDIGLGYTTNYSWVCGANGTNLADIPTYTGFLKCLYTAGMNGAVAYQGQTVTNGLNASFPTNSPPHWLQEMMALSHVHALFSHLENFLYDGDLLSGPQPHAISADQPAYEFTNTAGLFNDRVLVRQLNGQNQWLVTAWAADGVSNNVTVTVPTVGNLTVAAIPSASVYQVTMSGTNVQQTLLDEYASFPVILAPPIGFRVLSK